VRVLQSGSERRRECEQFLVNVEAKAHAFELYKLGAEEDGAEAATG